MNKRLQTFLLSLLTPGLGYLQTGDRKSFYKTITLFFGVIIFGVTTRLFVNFLGLFLIVSALISIYIFAAVHATIKTTQINSKFRFSSILKVCFTISFILITGLSFANRRTIMGFDILSMNVPVMQTTVLENENFLVNTWAYENSLPKRGDIIVHSFNGQEGLYLNRIVAIENDKIEIKNGIVFLNGQKLNESYVLSVNVTKTQSRGMAALTILKGNYFVMGDNRDASFGDSRFNGTITLHNIIGKTTDVISSQDKSRVGKTLK